MKSETDLPSPVPDPLPRLGPFDWLTGAMNAMGTVWIMGLMLLINADIFGRSVLNRPLSGVAELIAFSIVGIVFLQLAHTLRTGALTRSDVVLGGLQLHAPRLRFALLALFHLVGGALMALIAWTFWPHVVNAWNFPARHFMGNPGHFTVPQWPLFSLMLLGIAATAVQFLAMTAAFLHRALRPARPAT